MNSYVVLNYKRIARISLSLARFGVSQQRLEAEKSLRTTSPKIFAVSAFECF